MKQISFFLTFLVLIEWSLIGQTYVELGELFEVEHISKLNDRIEQISLNTQPMVGQALLREKVEFQFDIEYDYKLYYLNLISSNLKIEGEFVDLTAYEFEVLSKGDSIVLKRLRQRGMEYFRIEADSDAVQSFIGAHQRRFNSTFDLSKQELVLYEDEEFGWNCYACGQLPNKYVELIKIVESRDSMELIRWLTSISPQSQGYGVLGLTYLQSRGLKLSKETESLIKLVRKQSVPIRTCFLCVGSNYRAPLKELLSKRYLEENNEFLKFMLERDIIGK